MTRNRILPAFGVASCLALVGAFPAAAGEGKDKGDSAALEEEQHHEGEKSSKKGDQTAQLGEEQTMEGRIDAIDLAEGEVQIGERTFRAHPEDVSGLEPGQQVSLTYRGVGDNDWVSSVTPMQEGAAQEAAQETGEAIEQTGEQMQETGEEMLEEPMEADTEY